MIILGIDPGETLVGIGIIKKEKGDLSLVNYECITVDSDKKTAEKLLEISEKLSLIIEKYKEKNRSDLIHFGVLFKSLF